MKTNEEDGGCLTGTSGHCKEQKKVAEKEDECVLGVCTFVKVRCSATLKRQKRSTLRANGERERVTVSLIHFFSLFFFHSHQMTSIGRRTGGGDVLMSNTK